MMRLERISRSMPSRFCSSSPAILVLGKTHLRQWLTTRASRHLSTQRSRRTQGTLLSCSQYAESLEGTRLFVRSSSRFLRAGCKVYSRQVFGFNTRAVGSDGEVALRDSSPPSIDSPTQFKRVPCLGVCAESSSSGVALPSNRKLEAFGHLQDTYSAERKGFIRKFAKLFWRLAAFLGRLAAVAILVLALLPSILSTGPGLQTATALASRFIPGTLHVREAHLGWSKPILLKDATLTSPASLGGETLASVASINTDAKLFDIALGRSFDAFATSPWVDCSLAPSGQLKWVQLFQYEAGNPAASAISSLPLPKRDGTAPQDASTAAATASMSFSAEGRAHRGSLYISDGTAVVPREAQEILGRDVHIIGVLGSRNLRESAEELGLDLDDQRPQVAAEEDTATHTASDESASKIRRAELLRRAKRTGLDPAVITVASEHLDFEVSGWRQLDGRLELHGPAKANLQFTPALARSGLTRLSPLLSGILGVEEGVVRLELTTHDHHLPSKAYDVQIDPLRVVVNRQDLLAKVVDFLRLREAQEVGRASLLQGATSALRFSLDEQGVLDLDRFDLLISAGGKSKGVHLCTWGKVDPISGTFEIAVGVPPDTLTLVGLRGLDDKSLLVIPVRGSAASPRVDWTKAYKRLAGLAASHRKEPGSLRGQLLQAVVQGLDLRANAPGLADAHEVPPPPGELPWETDASLLQTDIHVDQSMTGAHGSQQ